MSKTKTHPEHAADPSDADAKHAWDALRKQLNAIPEAQLTTARVDVPTAVRVTLSVAADVGTEAMHARFAKLPEFEIASVDVLRTAALATWYAHNQLQSATATTSGAKLPVTLVNDAHELKRRMLKCAEYQLEDDDKASAEIADIRRGTGYLDDASDLQRLAALFDAHVDELSTDGKNYRATDAKDARRLAKEILDALAAAHGPEVTQWTTSLSRAWTFQTRAYDEVLAGARFLCRHDADVETRFPTLIGASRATAKRSKKAPGGATGGTAGPTGKPPATSA